MKDVYTPAEANVLTLRFDETRDGIDLLSASTEVTPGGSGGIGGGGYDPGGWT